MAPKYDLSSTLTPAVITDRPAGETPPAEKPDETPAPAEATPKPAEKPAETEAPAELPDLEDVLSPEDEEALGELDKRMSGMSEAMRQGVRAALQDVRREESEEEREEPAADPRDAKIRDLEAQIKQRDEAAQSQQLETAMRAAHHEMKSCIGKLKMTKDELNRTLDYFQKNSDLEGVISFEQGALRANPGIADRLKTPSDAGRNGSLEDVGAEVVARGGGGTPPPSKPPTFQAGRGRYDQLFAHLAKNGTSAKMIRHG